jgi:hypothetical protein
MGFRKLLICKVLLAVIVVIAAGVVAVAQTVIDKTVATVDDRIGAPELITYSDLLWTLALQPRVSIDPPTSEDLNRALEIVINQRLIAIEAKRLPGAPPTDNFERMMEERVKIEQYLDFRFRSFVVITTEDARKYYRDVFTPDFRKRYPGLLMPSFEDKQLEINEILSEERVAESLERFLDDAEQRAEIVIINPV